MPVYEYQRADGTIFEILQKISEPALTACPTTGQDVQRIISQNAFHLKGSGWYKTDYSNKTSSTENKTASGSAETSVSSVEKTTTPATSSTEKPDTNGSKGKESSSTSGSGNSVAS
jgi:putative FmdB family regulatory protein